MYVVGLRWGRSSLPRDGRQIPVWGFLSGRWMGKMSDGWRFCLISATALFGDAKRVQRTIVPMCADRSEWLSNAMILMYLGRNGRRNV